jgi:hypothetical protein
MTTGSDASVTLIIYRARCTSNVYWKAVSTSNLVIGVSRAAPDSGKMWKLHQATLKVWLQNPVSNSVVGLRYNMDGKEGSYQELQGSPLCEYN